MIATLTGFATFVLMTFVFCAVHASQVTEAYFFDGPDFLDYVLVELARVDDEIDVALLMRTGNAQFFRSV